MKKSKVVKAILTKKIILKYEGECVAILKGKVIAHSKLAEDVFDKMKTLPNGLNATFTSIPKSSLTIVR